MRGSRNSDGNVPYVYWNRDNDKMYVNWYNRDNSDSRMRARSEVSIAKGTDQAPFVYLYDMRSD